MTSIEEKEQAVVRETAGEEGIAVYAELRKKPDFSEFKLAEKLNQEVHTTRNLLYKFYQQGLASFERRKDLRKGWYIYYWTFQSGNIERLYCQILQKKLDALSAQLGREEGEHFYACPDRCIRLGFEQAFEFEFHCPECGHLINEEVTEGRIARLKEEKEKLEKEFSASCAS